MNTLICSSYLGNTRNGRFLELNSVLFGLYSAKVTLSGFVILSAPEVVTDNVMKL